jgi:hypothetical protein
MLAQFHNFAGCVSGPARQARTTGRQAQASITAASGQSETSQHVSDDGSFRRNRPWRLTGPPMTLGNMRANGVRSLDVCCWLCHHRAIPSADPWPDHVPVPSFGPRMVCTRCGILGARPNWREQPARLSGAGTAAWQ